VTFTGIERMVVAASGRLHVSLSGLYALTPDCTDTDTLADLVRAALAGGASAVQYRNKTGAPALRLEQARALRKACSASGATFIVNDDVELAGAVDADGVHLGRDDATVASARRRLGPEAIIGVSCYDSLARADAAVGCGADYVAFGSFFESSVKPQAVRATDALLSTAKLRWNVSVVAIGGITAANAPLLIAAGADAVAVISDIFGPADPRTIEQRARAIATLFHDTPENRRGGRDQ
jgi:thiamine-phosphate pyrophosphorylase